MNRDIDENEYLLKKLHLENKKFVMSEEIKAYCKSMKLDYATAVRYFIARGYITRIFRGIFYVKSLAEKKVWKEQIQPSGTVARELELKNVRN